MTTIQKLLGIAVAATALWPAICSAQERPVGSTYYRCSIVHRFLALDRYGKPPQFVDLTHPKRPASIWPLTTKEGPEILEGQAEVENDGRISDLRMAWLQSGTLGFPYSARADLDGILLKVTFGHREEGPKGTSLTRFDPEKLYVRIEVQQRDKIKVPLTLRLDRYPFSAATLGGLADIPAWQHSASIGMWWRDLRAFAAGDAGVNFQLNGLSIVEGRGLAEKQVLYGKLDLSPIPAVIEQFAAVEAMLQQRATNRASECTKITVEQQIDEESNSAI